MGPAKCRTWGTYCQARASARSQPCIVFASSKDTTRSKWLAGIKGSSQAVKVHLDNYLRAVDHLAAMQVEESEEPILAHLLHSVDKTRFGTECIVVDSWGRWKRTLDNIVSYLKNAEQKQRSAKAEGRAMEAAMPLRLQSIVVNPRRRDHPRDSRSGGQRINNTTPAGGSN